MTHRAHRLALSALMTFAGVAAAQTAPPPADPAAFARCLDGIRSDAAKQGIPADAFARLTGDLQPDMSVLPLLDSQPEFTTPLWDYLAGLVDEQRVSEGRAMLAEHRDLLARVSAQYGVDDLLYYMVRVGGRLGGPVSERAAEAMDRHIAAPSAAAHPAWPCCPGRLQFGPQ